MSASPFRSHLLQQWARGSQGRAPAAVVPWLKQHRGSSHEVDDDGINDHRQCRCAPCRSIATLHSTCSSKRSTMSASPPPDSPTHSTPRYFTTAAVVSGTKTTKKLLPRERSKRDISASFSTEEVHTCFSLTEDLEEEEENSVGKQAIAFQSILLNRRTATRLKAVEGLDPEKQVHILIQALERAVRCAQMAPNHKHTEPFSFRRFLVGSQAAQQLADISYHVTLRKTESHPNAESKRQKWLDIPGFLVALVHENQEAVEDGFLEGDAYKALPYMPPETERQLEDYAAACAAVQNILLSLHSEGIGSKWATGPVIHTSAFRRLAQALPTDRIVGLIMVGGTTEFESEREAQITTFRRSRRRSIKDDLLLDLP